MQTGRATKTVIYGVLKRINEVGHRNFSFNAWGIPKRYQVVDEDNRDISAFLDMGEMLQWLDGFQTCLYMAGTIKRPKHSTR